MQGRNILLLILITAAVIVSGCTSPEADGDAQPLSPTPAPEVTEAQAVGAGRPAPTPPVPAREEPKPYKVGFVDPRTYHVPTPTPTIALRRPPDDVRVSERMVEYATATIERPGRILATEVYHIPFPYWDLTVKMTPTNEYPSFEMEVLDPDDPNRVIKTIRYSRGDILSVEDGSEEKKETFTIREGYGDFYFVIHSEFLKSLTITIEVPEKYLI